MAKSERDGYDIRDGGGDLRVKFKIYNFNKRKLTTRRTNRY
jgi:hypothetical protein